MTLAPYYNAHKIKSSYGFGKSGGTLFRAVHFSGGLGIRLIGKKNNINYLNVSGGLALGVKNSGKGVSNSTGFSYLNEAGEATQLFTSNGKNNGIVVPSVYLNLSKDFVLTKNLYFLLDYRLNIGWLTTYEETLTFQTEPNLNEVINGTLKMKGTSQAFQIGFKYKFVPKSKR